VGVFEIGRQELQGSDAGLLGRLFDGGVDGVRCVACVGAGLAGQAGGTRRGATGRDPRRTAVYEAGNG
jgi:hypothetical protein